MRISNLAMITASAVYILIALIAIIGWNTYSDFATRSRLLISPSRW